MEQASTDTGTKNKIPTTSKPITVRVAFLISGTLIVHTTR